MLSKRVRFSITALALIALISLAAFFGAFMTAHAERNVTVDSTHVFSVAGKANVIAHEEDGAEGAKEYYTMFVFSENGDAVNYRKNLAYRWWEAEESSAPAEPSESEEQLLTAEGVEGKFGMELGFADLNFEKFVITFQSQQYDRTEDGKTTNYVIFFPSDVESEEGKVHVLITDDEEAVRDGATEYAALDPAKISIKFTSYEKGVYSVTVSDGAASEEGEFKNIGGSYSKYVSASRSDSVTPLSFKAVYPELSEDENAEQPAVEDCHVVLYSLNGQSFKLKDVVHNEDGDYYYGGTVTDDCAPVVCFDDDFYYFQLGQQIKLNYTVIDVLASTPRSTVYYYTLTYEQKADAETKYLDKSLFEEVPSTSSDIPRLEGGKKENYMPVEADLAGTRFDYLQSATKDADDGSYDLPADSLVKVYINVSDISSGGEEADVLLDWYIPEDCKVKINSVPFEAVAEDKLGVKFNNDDADAWAAAVADYQQKVTEAAEGLSAGSSSRLYLPSADSLFVDNATSYEDLKISVYYYHNSKQSSTNLATNNLSINVTQDGYYTFTLFATDAQSNEMYYIKEGKVETFPSSEIWNMYDDEELKDILPWFEFKINYSGVTVEAPGAQGTGYVGTRYSGGSFTINGIQGSYSTAYHLYLFDRGEYFNETGKTLTYAQFIEDMQELYENASTRRYFTEIPPVSELEETDENYEELNAYDFSRTSTSFTPQDANAFYLIKAQVTDTRYNRDVVAYMGVSSSVRANTLKGETKWLQNNIASIVLLSVAGLSLIGIILLLVIRPREKGDVESRYERLLTNKKK